MGALISKSSCEMLSEEGAEQSSSNSTRNKKSESGSVRHHNLLNLEVFDCYFRKYYSTKVLCSVNFNKGYTKRDTPQHPTKETCCVTFYQPLTGVPQALRSTRAVSPYPTKLTITLVILLLVLPSWLCLDNCLDR